MGFTAGLYRYPRYKKPLSYRDYHYINTFIDYDKNPWAQQHFHDANEYAMGYIDFAPTQGENYIPPSQEVIDFFREKLLEDESGNFEIYESMGFWYSNGGGAIYTWFENLAREKNEERDGCNLHVTLTKKDVGDFAKFCWEYIEENLPVPCNVYRAFKYLPNENDEEDMEEPDIKLFRCDGIELEYEDGTTKRMTTASEEETILMPKNYGDEWSFLAFTTGLNMAIDILCSTDFEKEFIVYSGGW